MAVTVTDYRWFRDWRPDWAQAYCLTVISDDTVDDALARLGATDVAVAHGFDEFFQRAVDCSPHGYDPFDTLVGAIDVGQGAVLLIEVNGFVGVTERLIGPLAPRRTIVALFRNVNAVYRLHWWRDGQLLLDMDLLFPSQRFGAHPDALLGDMTEVGLAVDDPVGTGVADVSGVDHDAAGLALLQRITGVAVTADLLQHCAVACGRVVAPSAEDQQRYGTALHATWRHPTVW
jgi:hypothetical protein